MFWCTDFMPSRCVSIRLYFGYVKNIVQRSDYLCSGQWKRRGRPPWRPKPLPSNIPMLCHPHLIPFPSQLLPGPHPHPALAPAKPRSGILQPPGQCACSLVPVVRRGDSCGIRASFSKSRVSSANRGGVIFYVSLAPPPWVAMQSLWANCGWFNPWTWQGFRKNSRGDSHQKCQLIWMAIPYIAKFIFHVS